MIQTKQTGQTLIETMVAIFIMVMGITAALGLANYSLNASTGIRKQIIGMGLARQGIEAIKNMRDTNWLVDTLSTSCYNFSDGTNSANCYPNWLTAQFNIDPGATNNVGKSYRLNFNGDPSVAANFWQLQTDTQNWGLDTASTANAPLTGFYTVTNLASGSANGTSDYYRQIIITPINNTAPFNHSDIGPRLTVSSRVWWKDKNCPASSIWPGTGKCSIELQMYLTNWKTTQY